MNIALKVAGIMALTVVMFVVVRVYLDFQADDLYRDLPREFRSEETHNNHTFTVVYEAPPMSFGSGHKILILADNDTGKTIEEVYFGEHPLTIKHIDFIRIVVTVPDSDYAKSWCQKNKVIGRYAIMCAFSTGNQ